MKRKSLWLMSCAVTAAAALLSGCGGSGEKASPGGAPDTAPSAKASGGRSVGAMSDKVAIAEQVKDTVETRLSPHEDHFGSGGKSPCSTASAKMFTRQCEAAAEATNEDAAFALAQAGSHAGFASLRSVAQKIQKSRATYRQLGCATNPAEAATRHACLEPAAVLAQGFPDLRDGVNLGLAGK
ncbi:hypothetical protein ABT071_10210 [Streptomyces sp. NPDC002506]|uniref:hypothetical protein n=1 Tax=Streptomyces sp. NPDC002506 TaxID=3154536 RepID=UPI003328AF87